MRPARPTIDVARLQTLTREARTAPDAQRRAADARYAHAMRERVEDEAAVFIAEIPAKLEAAALRGEQHAEVLTERVSGASHPWLTSEGFRLVYDGSISLLLREYLSGVALIVYDYCVDQKLRVYVNVMPEGETGFQVEVHW